MVSSFTPNKSLEKPANGDYVDTWNVPVNGDMDIIDQAFGGVTSFNATAGSATLTDTEYRSLIFLVSGAIAAPVTYTFPAGIGGQWIVRNTTTDSSGGPHALTFASAGGGTSVVVPRTNQTVIYSDGTNVRLGVIASTGGIGDQAVTTAKIADGALSADVTGRAKMADNFVTTAKLDDASVTVAKVSATGTPSSSTFFRGDGAWASVSTPSSLPNLQLFTSSGTFTVPAGITQVKVTVIGGGGGGGGANANGYVVGGGGGGGGGSIRLVTGLTPGGTVAVTVGAGGTAANDTAGGSGGTSSFGAFCSATGGSGGGRRLSSVDTRFVSGATAAVGGAAGTGSSGDINVGGTVGVALLVASGTNSCPAAVNYIGMGGGNGGDSPFGLGTGGLGNTGTGNGSAGSGYGGGGGGGRSTTAISSGAAGQGGCVIVEW